MAAASFLNAADLDDPRGLYAAGMMYTQGVGVTANPETAIDLLQKAASLAHAPSNKVLSALSQGKDVSILQIIVVEPKAFRRSTGAQQSPKASVATSRRTLVIVAATLAIFVSAGVSYWKWAKDSAGAPLNAAAGAESVANRLVKDTGAATVTQSPAVVPAPVQGSVPALPLKVSPQSTAYSVSENVAGKIAEAKVSNWLMVDKRHAALYQLAAPQRGDQEGSKQANKEGLVAIKANDIENATQAFAKSLALDAGNVEARNNLAYAHMLVGNFDNADWSG